jgi:hypothetical protein
MKHERILYLECASGISGDMTVGALLDLGADEEKLRKALASLPLDGYEIGISRVKKSGLDACDFAVHLQEDNHDHDMAYLHGDDRENMHVHNQDEEHHHGQHQESHHHHGQHQAHGHVHRGLSEITEIIGAGALTAGAKALALRIFDILADAEAKAHGVPKDQVHFHEVGAVDSIVDIVATAVCLDDLAPDRILISPLSEGQGTVRCQHGLLPIPVPAVANIASAYGLPLRYTQVAGELVTPTGAAIAAAVMQEHNERPDHYRIERIGMGAGKRDYATAGLLRAMWICPLDNSGAREPKPGERIVKLEANIDDATGQQFGYCMDCLMRAGARDVSFLPVYMKKNRPAYEIHVITDREHVPAMEEILFSETTTIGIRRQEMERTIMERELRSVQTIYGQAQVKICRYGELVKVYPEYDSIVQICQKTGKNFGEIRQLILDACQK